MEEEIQAASNFDQFVEILLQHESETKNIIYSITYNVKSQTVFIRLRELVPEMDNLAQSSGNTCDKFFEATEIRRLSQFFCEKFPILEKSFAAWKPSRVKLVKNAEARANYIHWNILWGSAARLMTSAADLVATWNRYVGKQSDWITFTLEYASIVNFVTLFIQAQIVLLIHEEIKSSIEEDKTLFKPIETWFQQSQELDAAVRNFFPYGIDPTIVADIERSAKAANENCRIFISVVASNVPKCIGLVKDKDFLSKAKIFSSSEAGVKWYRKILFETDPMYIECLKYDFEKEIKDMDIKKSVSKTEMTVNGTLPVQDNLSKFKNVLNGLSIFSAVVSIWNAGKNDDTKALRKLGVKAKIELEAMKKVLDLLKPDN